MSRFAEARDVFRVVGPEALGDQHVEALPQDRVARPLECLLGRRVEDHDPLFAVDGDDRIHRGDDDLAHAGLRAIQRQDRSIALGGLTLQQGCRGQQDGPDHDHRNQFARGLEPSEIPGSGTDDRRENDESQGGPGDSQPSPEQSDHCFARTLDRVRVGVSVGLVKNAKREPLLASAWRWRRRNLGLLAFPDGAVGRLARPGPCRPMTNAADRLSPHAGCFQR